MKKRCKFYAVIKGYKRGILDDWAECKSYVDGYGGNQYKTILDKGIMPSEKVLDFPVDCNTLTGSVNL